MGWFRRRRGGSGGAGRGGFPWSFPARFESADPGLYFDAEISYRWSLAPDGEGAAPLHPDAVARSLLRNTAKTGVADYPLLDAADAEDAANRRLSEEIRDGRLTVAGRVRLTVPPEAEHQARDRSAAAARLRTREAAETARIEVMRDRLLSPGMGLLWWLDRHADLSSPDGTLKERLESAIGAFQRLTDELRKETAEADPDEVVRLRARFDDLLSVFEDPEHLWIAEESLEKITAIIKANGSGER